MNIFNLIWSLNNHLANHKVDLQRPKDQLTVMKQASVTSERVRPSLDSRLEAFPHPVAMYTHPYGQSRDWRLQAL